MFISHSSCTFEPDESSPRATAHGDGDLLINASSLGLAPGEAPPPVIDVERAPGVVVRFEGGGRVYLVDSKAGSEDFVGWSYWEEDATFDDGDCPVVNFKILNR